MCKSLFVLCIQPCQLGETITHSVTPYTYLWDFLSLSLDVDTSWGVIGGPVHPFLDLFWMVYSSCYLLNPFHRGTKFPASFPPLINFSECVVSLQKNANSPSIPSLTSWTLHHSLLSPPKLCIQRRRRQISSGVSF